jgi:hypothetical protein
MSTIPANAIHLPAPMGAVINGERVESLHIEVQHPLGKLTHILLALTWDGLWMLIVESENAGRTLAADVDAINMAAWEAVMRRKDMVEFDEPESEFEHALSEESAREREDLMEVESDDEGDQFLTDAEADGDALASAGWGTDEDYGGGSDLGDEF